MTHARHHGQGDLRITAPGESASFSQTEMTSFDEVYDQPDPRPFFRLLGHWDYQTPHHAQEVFRRIAAARTRTARAAAPVTVLDICCSYGINAALLNHDLTLEDLYAHYTSPQATALTTAELIEWDRAYYAAHRRPDAHRVIGLDIAANAISYALAVGLLDEGFTENLEAAPPTTALLRAAQSTVLVTVTGGASFLSPRTFQPLLAAADEPVWIAAFVLRTGSYRHIADGLTPYGLITEKAAAPTYPQRRFTSVQEQRYAITAVTAAGEDPRGKETDGYFHTALHLSRPAKDTAALPLISSSRDS
jgi:SAM-dependent methyltransferase